ncbi:endosomal/lysosomal potassium channel TMEM175 [Cyclopterus lumpus]|uniref:Endosomal/lysosomal proton channel TMEM175 n=1 Tax=Cyclopterus lumpus TaxID=8103 RepID=A0A8C2XMM8_CYCLU|nr:endosomal/lysosomal potassium channel TMEM175 [Cyclopterus lumpus]XP_034397175.1 endosomal/lysosomal potassium channel TMEM175 [Cyclopterus lumpus]XP_034397176.1 endosomal/lysosomal potassium channel TMEM175 [Cyclopterus lumpus]XP_034397177.1 endosomal/lysosomal potassium channel TMEM175 [Cyclopterus lumpus]
MGENVDSEIIEHHVEEEVEVEEVEEEKGTRSHAASGSSFLGSVTPSDREGHSGTQSSHRLLAYSDALISIIATVMILPVAHTKMENNEELRESVQLLLTTKIAVYLMTFLIVTVAWAAHIRLFQVIVRIDDCLALLNLACMMLITFLPYTFSLMAAFPENILGLLLFCGCVMVMGVIQSGIVLYAFSRPFLLNEQIQISENQTFYKHHILKVIMRVPLMCFFASIFSFIFFQLSYVLLAIVIFLPYISQSLKWCRSKAIGQEQESPDSMLFYTYLPNEPLSKDRVEAFSDGVYAIVATLLILDICEDNVPDPAVVQKQFAGSLVAALRVYGPEYLAYFGSFATVGLLWFAHHSLFLHVTKTTRFMGLLNTFSLACVGGLPLAYQLTHEFPPDSRNELEAIQISCVIIFFAGGFQLAIWVVALHGERETLHPYVRYGGREHAFMFAKLSLYPCVALGTFFLTCVLSRFSAPIFHLMEITVPFAFLVLRLLVRVGLASLRMIFCPDRNGAAEEADDEARAPLSALVA